MLTKDVEQISEWTVGTSTHSCRSIQIHVIDKQRLLLLLLREDTLKWHVVMCVWFYCTFYKSYKLIMPTARESSTIGGKAKESSPVITEDCSSRVRLKDECSHGACTMPDE